MVSIMEYRDIPKAGIRISRLALGTVELGMEYGIGRPGISCRPSMREAEAIIHTAIACGINLFDTAPAYGESEVFLGKVLSNIPGCNVHIATKIGPYEDIYIQPSSVLESLEHSLRNLRRERIDVVQIHNATATQLYQSPLMEILEQAQSEGKIGVIGASVYGEKDALAALDHPSIATLQIAYNLLDQRMAVKVMPAAERAGIALLGRSTLLKGVLTSRRHDLPKQLHDLWVLAESAASWADSINLDLPEAALRFCLGNQALSSVLIGVSSLQELYTALANEALGPLPVEQLTKAIELTTNTNTLIDPRFWGIN